MIDSKRGPAVEGVDAAHEAEIQNLRRQQDTIVELARSGQLLEIGLRHPIPDEEWEAFSASPDELRAVLARLGDALPEARVEQWLAEQYPGWSPPDVWKGKTLSGGVQAWREARLVYALPLDGTWYYPLWQFVHRDVLSFVLQRIAPALAHAPWAIASFLVTRNPFVAAESPLAALLTGMAEHFTAVAKAIRLYGQHGAA